MWCSAAVILPIFSKILTIDTPLQGCAGTIWTVFHESGLVSDLFSHCCCCAVCNVMLLISDHVTDIVPGYIYLEDWSRWGGSYGNNTRVICCPAPGRPRRTTNHSGVVAVTPDRPWSTPIITWLNNLVSNIFMTKYVQNHHQIEQRHLLASIVTSRIPPQRWEL